MLVSKQGLNVTLDCLARAVELISVNEGSLILTFVVAVCFEE